MLKNTTHAPAYLRLLLERDFLLPQHDLAFGLQNICEQLLLGGARGDDLRLGRLALKLYQGA